MLKIEEMQELKDDEGDYLRILYNNSKFQLIHQNIYNYQTIMNILYIKLELEYKPGIIIDTAPITYVLNEIDSTYDNELFFRGCNCEKDDTP